MAAEDSGAVAAVNEPRLADLAVHHFDDILAGLDGPGMWEQALASEPFPQIRIAHLPEGRRPQRAAAALWAFEHDLLRAA